ncbi:hypothetical protein EV44_g3537 [Erysiphe necator]|uniref:Uncharacterized protein n=1 Tax=Uncinula necator TaxID=52586 RepID=A0A0B1PBS5_UNCNE|nr:hypothetical protein EV44_g3537 [Erysiphe necator]
MYSHTIITNEFVSNFEFNFCLLDCQHIGPPPSIATYPLTERRVDMSEAKSESEKITAIISLFISEDGGPNL